MAFWLKNTKKVQRLLQLYELKHSDSLMTLGEPRDNKSLSSTATLVDVEEQSIAMRP
jgi:hypothetical protein